MNSEIDARAGDWFPGDTLADNAPDNARFHRPLVFHQDRRRRDTMPGAEYSFSEWKSELDQNTSSLEKILREKFGASGPGIAVAARALVTHNEAHVVTLKIEEQIEPLQQALRDPVKARVLGLSEEVILQQLSSLQELRKESLIVVQTTDEALVEFGLDNVHFRPFVGSQKQYDDYGYRVQTRTVLVDSIPKTRQHHNNGQEKQGFLNRFFNR